MIECSQMSYVVFSERRTTNTTRNATTNTTTSNLWLVYKTQGLRTGGTVCSWQTRGRSNSTRQAGLLMTEKLSRISAQEVARRAETAYSLT